MDGWWLAGPTAGIVTAGETLVPGGAVEEVADVAGDGDGQLLLVIVGVGLTGTEKPGLSIGCGAD